MNTKQILYKYREDSYREIESKINISLGAISANVKDAVKPRVKVENAVIYAAGIGSRLKPLTNEIPKPLLEVNGKSMIESTIENLRKNGIENIYVVVGHLKEKFNDIAKKYNLTLIDNPNYALLNNIESLKVASPFLTNTLFVEGDIYWYKDVLDSHYEEPTMYSFKSESINSEWSFNKRNGYFVKTKKGSVVGDDCWAGAYFIDKEQAEMIQNFFKNEYIPALHGSWFAEELFWHLKMKFENYSIKKSAFDEIDTVEEYNQINGITTPIFHDPFDAIIYFMNVKREEVKNLKPIKGGLTNDTYSFEYNNKKFVLRLTKEETNANVDRYSEYDIIESIKSLDISCKKIVFSQETGIAIFEFLNYNHLFNPSIEGDIEKAALQIKKLHNSKLKSGKVFDPKEKINKYLELSKGHKFANNEWVSKYKEDVFKIIDRYYTNKDNFVTSHNDLLAGNILVDTSRAYIIDWELGGMNDCYWDLASLSNENNLSDNHINEFEKTYGKIDREKLRDFRKLAALCWATWSYQHKEWDQIMISYFENNIQKLREAYDSKQN